MTASSIRAYVHPLLAALGLALALAGCSHTDIAPGFADRAKHLDAKTFDCCFQPEKFYPAPVVGLAIALSDQFGPSTSDAIYGSYEDTTYPGLLTGNTEAQAALMQGLKPMDLMLISNHSYRMGRLVPGRFSHVLTYLGSEAELRAAGLWNDPALVPHHDEIRAGRTLLEAAAPTVRLRSPAKGFEADRVLVLAPHLTPAQRRAGQKVLIDNLDTQINYSMGIVSPDGRYSCSGLVDHALPELGLRHRRVYGETVVMPDDIAAQAIRGEGMRVMRYIVGTPGGGFTRRSTFALMVDIAAFWGVPPG